MIEATNVTRYFGDKAAVAGVSFSVGKGEVLGFLGPNGAGKSTTMRMITGFLPLSGGRIAIGGCDIAEKPVEAKRLFGYLPENAPAYQDMSVAGFLDFSASIRGLSGKARSEAIARAVKLCHLEKVMHQSIDTLSKGYHHRVCFAQAILHDPPVLILDEPTDGLDPNQKHEMRELIREMGKSKAIIVSTHILEEVEAICTRVIIIDRGELVFNGTPQQLKEKAPHGDRVLACIAVNVMDTAWRGKDRRYIQLGTVMTDPACRGQGLSRRLMEAVLADWEDACDGIYLFANETVLEFYPRFGFERAAEYEWTLPVRQEAGPCRRLDMDSAADRERLRRAYDRGSPYAALPARNNFGLLMFYAGSVYKEAVYYMED